MIIIPAICKQKGSPFGEPGLCNQIWYGLCCSFYGGMQHVNFEVSSAEIV